MPVIECLPWLSKHYPNRMPVPENVIAAIDLLQETCVLLTKGQYLDMAYEEKDDLPLDAYWQMVGGKTAALTGLQCCHWRYFNRGDTGTD